MKKIIAVIISAIMLTSILPLTALTVGAQSGVVLGVNALDTSGAEGHALVMTRKSGTAIPNVGNYFTWWRVAIFEYSDEAEAYVVTAVSLAVGGSAPKQGYIPEDGFVLAVNLGNDYGHINYINKLATDTYNKLENVSVGDKAYVTGMDLATGYIDKSAGNHWDKDFTSNAKIYIGQAPSDVEVYTPERSAERLETVKLSLEDGDIISGSQDWTFSWEEVAGATAYIVNISDNVSGDLGNALLLNKSVNDTTITIPKSKLVVGYVYRISVSAVANGKRSSLNTNVKVTAVSDRAVNGSFKDKTVVAFGDSITAFTGWVNMLSGDLGTTVINAGVGGNSTNDAVKRIDSDVLSKNPDIVIMMFGMNDQAIQISSNTPLVSPTQYERNYRRMIEKMRERGIDVVLMTGHHVCTDTSYYVAGQYDLDYGTGNLENYYNVIRKLADEYKLNLIDMTASAEAEGRSKMCAMGDGIHLSTYGHEMYAKWIGDFMYDGYVMALGMDESSEEPSVEESSEESSNDKSAAEEPSAQASSDAAASADDASTPSDAPSKGLSGGATAAICAAIGVVLVVGIVVMRKLRKKK